MFKPLIKKVREESSNASILPEDNPDEINGLSTTRESGNSFENGTSPSLKSNNSTHRRSSSITQRPSIAKSNHHLTTTGTSSITPQISVTDSDESKELAVKSLSDIFSPYVGESITIENYAQILKAWIDSKEETFQQKDDTIRQLTQETNNLQKELAALRLRLTEFENTRQKSASDSAAKAPYLQKQIDSLRSENETLKSTSKSLRVQLNEVEAERDDLLIKSTDLASECTHFRSIHSHNSDDLQRQRAETEQHQAELERLRQVIAERDAIIEQQDQRLLIHHQTQAVQTEEDTSFVQILAEPDVDTTSKLQAELEDKNRTIKTWQQRYNDLRKTLQREFHASVPKDLNQMASSSISSKTNSNMSTSPTTLPLIHYDELATSQSDIDAAKRAATSRSLAATRKNVTFTTIPTASPAILPHTNVELSSSTKTPKSSQRTSVDGSVSLNGTNFKYLKHVVLKFMTASEDEAVYLIRAVSTLLNFSSDEERLLRETLDYKMSWFGKMSRLKSPLTTTSTL